MKKKEYKFDKYIGHVLSNIEGWNSKVKDKTLIINKGDSIRVVEAKIYRHLNEYSEENWQVKPDKAKYRE